jgi:putative sigma-54 modulation protein
MQIHVRSNHVAIDGTTHAHVERRLQFSLGRLAPRILRVTAQLIDLNGPRGGVDKECRITIRLRPTGTVVVKDRDADLVASIDRAAGRAARSVDRALKRARDRARSVALPSSPLLVSIHANPYDYPAA